MSIDEIPDRFPVRPAAPPIILTLIPVIALGAVISCGGPAEDGFGAGTPAGPEAASHGGETGPATASVGSIEIHDPRVRITPGGASAAAYLTVVDSGGDGDRLVGVRTAAAESASLHESVDDDGVHRMVERPEGFEVPPGGTLELAPGGKHVMLTGLDEAGPGQDGTILLTLELERAGTVEVGLEAAGAGGSDTVDEGAGHEGMDHSGH